jgi:hypothetical protein
MLQRAWVRLVSTAIVVGLSGGAGLPVQGAEMNSSSTQPAKSQGTNGRQVVATLFGENIYADELQPPPTIAPAGRPRSPEELSRHASQQLARKIVTPLKEQFIEENRLEPTAEELKHTADLMRQVAAKQDREERARLAELEARLQANDLEPRQKDKFLREKQAIERTIENHNEIAARTKNSQNGEALKERVTQLDDLKKQLETEPTSTSARRELEAKISQLEAELKIFESATKDMPERMADFMLGPWKFNRALYRKYGGTVIWQQAGIEAVGAMRAWLEEHEKAGHFQILDPEMQDEFWRYYRREDHPFQIKDEDPFKLAPWEKELARPPR